MYNLTVDVAHTFFVGDGQWLVHNDDCLDIGDPFETLKNSSYLSDAERQEVIDNETEVRRLMGLWDAGTFAHDGKNVGDSIAHHYNKHGEETGILTYLRCAEGMYNQVRSGRTRGWDIRPTPDRVDPTRLTEIKRYTTRQGSRTVYIIIDNNNLIRSYGKNKKIMGTHLQNIEYLWEERRELYKQLKEKELPQLEYVNVEGYERYSFVGQIDLNSADIAGYVAGITSGFHENGDPVTLIDRSEKAIAVLSRFSVFSVDIFYAWYSSELSTDFPLTKHYLLLLDSIVLNCILYLQERINTLKQSSVPDGE